MSSADVAPSRNLALSFFSSLKAPALWNRAAFFSFFPSIESQNEPRGESLAVLATYTRWHGDCQQSEGPLRQPGPALRGTLSPSNNTSKVSDLRPVDTNIMSRFYPHTPYAEEQPLAHFILTFHVLARAVTTGSFIGMTLVPVRSAIAKMRSSPLPVTPLTQRLLLASGRSTAVTMGLLSLALVGRMWGREEIEWKDRSWRLLENQGQMETDDWTIGGMLAGGAVAAARKDVRMLGWRGVLGTVGGGSVVGLLGYLGWRYGVNGGKFPERKEMA